MMHFENTFHFSYKIQCCLKKYFLLLLRPIQNIAMLSGRNVIFIILVRNY